ncbi:Hpt domain-containing protein [Actibacterium sp. MT2.3-13A]|uniref:Hpt domain-containing protein n=1 Tax=Actibacterium sp. MT2.3-13A TaxID=2828332 RepID=UPI001BADD95C|nr:Hpt domain-containing protein [Actibacterium sp. MT2.3-13A]
MTHSLRSDAPPPNGVGGPLPAALERARVVFEAKLEEQIIRIEQCQRDVAADRAPGKAMREIGALAHKISGVAETVGHPNIGALAGTVDILIAQGQHNGLSEKAILKRINPTLERMLDALEAALDV